MPQMAPLSWAPLMILITISILLISSILFWAEMKDTSMEKTKKKSTTINWKW